MTDPDARPGSEGDEDEQEGDPKEVQEDDDHGVVDDIRLKLEIHQGGSRAHQ